jgi:predicted amidohydrolase
MTRLAVVQPALTLGAVEQNLVRIEDLIRDAHREHSPDVILVPEACTSPNVYAKVLLGAARPIDGQPFQLLTRLARELDCVIGGGFLAVRGKHAYGTYVLAEPNGAVHLHDKDTPSAWEHNYYRGGDDDGVTRCETLGAIVGLMSGWEWARNRTSRRVRAGGAQLVLGGMCWPSMPTNWPGPVGTLFAHEHRQWKEQQHELPGLVARIVGAPTAHAAHVGPVLSATPLAPGVPWPTTMIGESQICDRDGTILARLSEEDGEGHISAEVEITAPQPLQDPGSRLWIQDMSLITKAVAWYAMNAHGDVKYWLRHARNGFEWQQLPAADLPDEIPAGSEATAVTGPSR